MARCFEQESGEGDCKNLTTDSVVQRDRRMQRDRNQAHLHQPALAVEHPPRRLRRQHRPPAPASADGEADEAGGVARAVGAGEVLDHAAEPVQLVGDRQVALQEPARRGGGGSCSAVTIYAGPGCSGVRREDGAGRWAGISYLRAISCRSSPASLAYVSFMNKPVMVSVPGSYVQRRKPQYSTDAQKPSERSTSRWNGEQGLLVLLSIKW